jgi:hypothetical protein
VPSAVVCPAAASTATLTVTCDPLPAPDAGPDTGVDAASPDSAPPAPVPCTAAGQTGCVACSGNADGVCTPTEARFVQHDIDAGHAATTDCYSCMVNAGCIDDTLFGDTHHECGDLTGAFNAGPRAGAPSADLCLATVDCVLASSCQSGDIADCYCGIGASGSQCQTLATPAGPCVGAETDGLGLTSNTQVLQSLTDTTRPSGMANQLFACAQSNGCAACTR